MATLMPIRLHVNVTIFLYIWLVNWSIFSPIKNIYEKIYRGLKEQHHHAEINEKGT